MASRVGLLGVTHLSPRYSCPPSCSDSRSWLCRGVRQISTDSELLSAVFASSRALHLHLHRFSILYEPTVHLTGSDSCLSAWGGQAVIVGVTGIALLCSRSDSYLHIGLPVTSSSGVPSLSVAIAAQISSGVSNSSCGWTRRYSS